MKIKRLFWNILLIAVAVIWGTAFAFQREGMEHIEPITFTAARMTLAALAIGIVSIFVKKGSGEKSRKNEGEYLHNTLIGGISCGFFLVSASLFQQIGIVYTTAGKA